MKIKNKLKLFLVSNIDIIFSIPNLIIFYTSYYSQLNTGNFAPSDIFCVAYTFYLLGIIGFILISLFYFYCNDNDTLKLFTIGKLSLKIPFFSFTFYFMLASFMEFPRLNQASNIISLFTLILVNIVIYLLEDKLLKLISKSYQTK